jgi:hypothetical protein
MILAYLGKVLAVKLISVAVDKLFNKNEKEDMMESKSILASKTVWGGLIAIAAAGAGFWGYEIAAIDQAELVQNITAAASAVGGIIAIFGRIVAKKKLK